MRLTDTYTLPKAGRYARPKQANDCLPLVYGDLTPLADGGVWNAVEIDTTYHVYAVAAHPLPAALNTPGDTFRCFDDNGEIAPSAYVLTCHDNVEGRGAIASLAFAAARTGNVRVQGRGKADIDGALIENPIDIAFDLLTTMGVSVTIDAAACASARGAALSAGYAAAGIVNQDAVPAQTLTALLSSFLGDWWLRPDGSLRLALPYAPGQSVSVAAFLREPYQAASATRSLENLCNQVALAYAPNWSGSRDFDGGDDGAATADLLSQSRFGVRANALTWAWARTPATVAALRARLFARFASPLWLLTLTEAGLTNLGIERGDIVDAGCAFLRDEQGRPLLHQLWRVLEVERNLDAATISYRLQDTGLYFSDELLTYNGAAAVGLWPGRARAQF